MSRFEDLEAWKKSARLGGEYAKAPAVEPRTQICVGMDIECIDHETGPRWPRVSTEIPGMLHSLIRSVGTRAARRAPWTPYLVP